MTTPQESANGHHSYPPLSVENPAELDRADPATDKANNNQFPANAYHVPPARYSPRAHSYRRDDTLNLPPETTPLPERCQFMFSDGRQCTMARSDIHPSLCRYHSEREDQLFGDPAPGGMVVGASLDLPELYSACGDLTTAAGVNRALAQVFRLLAQRRISRQEAAAFGHLAQLLLRTISFLRSESTIRSGSSSRATNWSEGPVPEAAFADESNDRCAAMPHSAGSPLPMRRSPVGVIPKTSSPISAPTLADRAENGRMARMRNLGAGAAYRRAPRASVSCHMRPA